MKHFTPTLSQPSEATLMVIRQMARLYRHLNLTPQGGVATDIRFN